MSDKFHAITKNRAEELGYDVWNDFVVPPYYDQLDIYEARKPRIFIGGRGCGKTMLIRYLSHVSRFSENRENIESDDIENIGLYWRIDTHFASMMEKRGIEDDVWNNAFTHFSTIQIIIEILKSIQSIANSSFEEFTSDDIKKISFDDLKDYDSGFPSSFEETFEYLKSKQRRFHLWLNNVRTHDPIDFYPKETIFTCIETLKRQEPIFEDSIFFIYIDEYENLLESQKQLVNTWLKHSEMPLIFNLAMKRNSFSDRDSVGIEQISKIHDFRVHDLELLLDEKSFSIFSAEILFLRLQQSNLPHFSFIGVDLRSKDDLPARKDSGYQAEILRHVRDIFPTYNQEELGEQIERDKGLQNRLVELISLKLKERESSRRPDEFVIPGHPHYSVLIPALLSRPKLSVEMILGEIEKVKSGLSNDFQSGKMWYHNLFYGCLIMFYAPLNRICPIYAGFDTYIRMAKGNIRHFLELCHKSFSLSDVSGVNFQVDQKTQNEAAKQAATSLLGEVKSFGRSGNRLYTFLVRLGYIMYLSHLRPTQSEPEMTHFGITSHGRSLNEQMSDLLNEAIKWSVLFEIPSTKNKDNIESESSDYLLNPIYSSYFSISHRKGRKLNLSVDQIDILINGEVTAYQSLYKHLQTNWGIKISRQSNPTYAQLNFDLE